MESFTQLVHVLNKVRVGHGFDVHQLTIGDGLIIGGTIIACDKKVVAHSDGDVLVHALCDAILGAIGEGDIGRHFPDSDMSYKNMSSLLLLKQVISMMHQSSFCIGNIDATIVAQNPKMNPYIESMKYKIAENVGCKNTAINIKATTTEHLGYVGREEGIAAHCVVLLLPFLI